MNAALELAAERARRGQPLVWLDTAGHAHPQRDRQSWLASGNLRGDVRGNLSQVADVQALRELLVQTSASEPAFGWVEFDGSFHFARFTEVRRWGRGESSAEASSETAAGDGPFGSCLFGESGEVGRSTDARPVAEVPVAPFSALKWQPDSTDAAYLAAVARAKDYIAAGDIYQVNLARRWSMNWPPDASAFDLYRCWRRHAAAPQAAFAQLGGCTVLSASPETFLELDAASRRISTSPIKGTIRAAEDPDADARLRAGLLESPKERAELLMITDLLRNDLGRVAVAGSVAVPALLELESYGHLHHLVSTVTATLHPNLDSVDLLLATHPGGSISGAPKRRALEIIAELETHPRGLYCGAIGWMTTDSLRLSIAIRTAVLENGVLRYHAGSGIVSDSDPQQELAETELKTLGFRRALSAWKPTLLTP